MAGGAAVTPVGDRQESHAGAGDAPPAAPLIAKVSTVAVQMQDDRPSVLGRQEPRDQSLVVGGGQPDHLDRNALDVW